MQKEKPTSCKEAIARWQEKHPEEKAAEAKKVSLIAQIPSIVKMDNALNSLVACEHLSLSTNAIEKLAPLPGLKNLRILSVGRNNLKRLEKLEDSANTLEELWCSHNQIERLDGLSALQKLRVLYLSNNGVKHWDELLKLRDNPALEEILLLGNPIYSDLSHEECMREVIRRLPKIKKIDGDMVTAKMRQDAMNVGSPSANAPE